MIDYGITTVSTCAPSQNAPARPDHLSQTPEHQSCRLAGARGRRHGPDPHLALVDDATVPALNAATTMPIAIG